jgi:hypothetical protein
MAQNGLLTNFWLYLALCYIGRYTRTDDYVSFDEVVWTEIQTSSNKALRVAERVRYEQMSEMVGGPQNMANDPTKMIPVERAIQWFDEGWYQDIPNWPNWLMRP